MWYVVGDVVTDAQRALTGRVQAVLGDRLLLARPGGFAWTAVTAHCWTASPEERAAMTPRGAVRVIRTSAGRRTP